MERLNRILRVLGRELVDFDDGLPVSLEAILRAEPSISELAFLRKASRISGPLHTRRLPKSMVLRAVYREASRLTSTQTHFVAAAAFIEKHLQPGEEPSAEAVRQQIIQTFNTRKPHKKLLKAVNDLLQKIARSHQLELHGTKEYSGVDLTKRVDEARIGFQVKSPNDNINEAHIRAQHSKAREWQMDGYVLVLARTPGPKVDDAIQVAHHLFQNENRRKEMYCAVMTPGQLAELLRVHAVSV